MIKPLVLSPNVLAVEAQLNTFFPSLTDLNLRSLGVLECDFVFH